MSYVPSQSPLGRGDTTPEHSPSSTNSTPAPNSHSATDDPLGSLKKPKSTRRSVACKSCHSLKVKCTPADPINPGGPCIRCLNANRKCEIDLNQTRKRRKKSEIVSATIKEKSSVPSISASIVAELTPINGSVISSPTPVPNIIPSSGLAGATSENGSTGNNEDVIEKLKKEISKLQAQLQVQQNASNNNIHSHHLSHSRHRNSSSNATISDVDSPPFVSKFDLEREISILCDNSGSRLTDLTNDLKLVADRRTSLLRDGPIDVVSTGLLGMEEARERLDIYRNKIFVQYPLVEIPIGLTADDLRRDQPYLFNSIMSITSAVYSKNSDLDKALNIDNAAIQSITVEVMVAGTKTDEMIKSLLLLCIWYNSPELFRHRRYHYLSTVSVTMLHDLGIVARPSYSFKKDDGAISQNSNKKSSAEYMSLVLIVYFTTVSICLILKRTIYVKWTPYVEECCSSLEKSPDKRWRDLALFSRLSNLLDKIHHIIHAPEISERRTSTSHYIIHELQKSLSIIRSKIDDDDHANLAYYFSVEAYLHEPILSNVFTSEENPEYVRLTESSAKSISNCTNSCLNALDEFNKLTSEQLATIPLFHVSRIIYTAGMLLRLRFLILSLPSHIEKDLVPQHAILAIQKANRLIDQASSTHSLNHFLKKTRLVLQLFIQTYATQIQDLLRKNGETPQNLKPPIITKREINEMDRLNSIFRAHHEAGQKSLINDDAGRYTSNVPLDILSYAASYRRDGKDTNGKYPSKSSSSENADVGIGNGAGRVSQPNTPQTHVENEITAHTINNDPNNDANISNLRFGEQHNIQNNSLGLSNSSNMQMNNGNGLTNNAQLPPIFGANGNGSSGNMGMAPPLKGTTLPMNQHHQLRQLSLGGFNKPLNYSNLANPDQLEHSYWALNEEFWSDLLSTESDRINFSSNNHNTTQLNDEAFYMN
ncbi:transcription factor activity protein [Scheffersomyces xylosifermentans]|uniref:transcription factor activity protein n=1 Tax=Scheffersomyces xylosifermentans TaxID=1304137 RepID=UPI00315CAF64